ncbi:hypothetical protein T8K17_13210 [Thalassobaculum sp. OXR-137]|uniref:hypothetical protein n=1 Tax=Thalassobaculum sp. OXR-137 TaxID=3100173 RepID=UPI002AC96E7C|nr:hypothetical protein [Thalassobaculum sp. OXR-137]WPZ32200.1 hypothetical protein T8K17_13210 [Thalassobaculum sp. OXR-137]
MGKAGLRSVSAVAPAVTLAVTLAAALAACAVPPPPAAEGIGYREARFAEVEAMRAYRSCRDEGLALDRQARASGDAVRYLAVARLLEGCEADLGAAAAQLDLEERMRAYAVAVQSRLKGGDVAGARAGLDRFAEAFPARDLYFEDGASFLDSLRAVVAAESGRGSVPRPLAEELARIERWHR